MKGQERLCPLGEGHNQSLMCLHGGSRGINMPSCSPNSGWCSPLAEPKQKSESEGEEAGMEDGEWVWGGK